MNDVQESGRIMRRNKLHTNRKDSYSGDVLDYIVILEFFEKTDLTDSGAWNTLIFGFEPDLLQGHDLARTYVASFVHNTVGP